MKHTSWFDSIFGKKKDLDLKPKNEVVDSNNLYEIKGLKKFINDKKAKDRLLLSDYEKIKIQHNISTIYANMKKVNEIETKESIVIRLLKGDFEKSHGITFDEFIKIYNVILENSPEKLI